MQPGRQRHSPAGVADLCMHLQEAFMHELGLVRSIVDIVTGSAEESGAKQVKRVYLRVGKARDVVPELLDIAFAHLAKGTVAEGAKLVVTQTPVMGRCEKCGFIFPINLFASETWQCPVCHSQSYRLHSGREFDIDRIEVVRDETACCA